MIDRIQFFDTMTDADSSLTYFLAYNTEHTDFAMDPHYHAMRSENENVQEAANVIEALINSNFSSAMSTNNIDEALYYFGLASHIFQDKMAPQHCNANGPLVWYPGDFTSIRNIWNHSGELLVSPSATNKTAYKSRLQTELQALINKNPSWLNNMFVRE